MVVGVCKLRLILHDVNSLKSKRSIIKKIIERTKNRFPVSIAEVGDHDLWQSSVIGFCITGNDRVFINSSIDRVVDYIETLFLADIADRYMEIINI